MLIGLPAVHVSERQLYVCAVQLLYVNTIDLVTIAEIHHIVGKPSSVTPLYVRCAVVADSRDSNTTVAVPSERPDLHVVL